jgi:hypothetical protein
VSATARHTGGGAAAGAQGPAQRRSGGPRRPGRRGALPWLIAGAAIVVIALIVIVVLHLAQGGNSAANASANHGHPGASGSAGSSGAPTASQGSAIPAAFNGTWAGEGTQPPSDTYHVTVTLSAGQSSGLISYAGAGATCSGVLTPTSVSPTKMIMKLGTAQKGCANSTVTISLSRPNTVTFDEGNPAASGTLTRA